MTTTYFENYLAQQKAAYAAIPLDRVAHLVQLLKACHADDRQLFVFGNGGSAANASHFITDLGKGASDTLHPHGSQLGIPTRRFRCLSLSDNTAWITALGNDYAYEDVFVGQLQNFARPGDLVFTMSVSGNSPNLVKAVEWANTNQLTSIALVGSKRGRLAELAHEVIVIDSDHYGRVEDAHMTICHMLCYAFMEG